MNLNRNLARALFQGQSVVPGLLCLTGGGKFKIIDDQIQLTKEKDGTDKLVFVLSLPTCCHSHDINPTHYIDQDQILNVCVVALVLADMTVTHRHQFSKAGPTKKGGSSTTPGGYAEDESLILSKQSPVDMGFKAIVRNQDALPSTIWGNRSGPLPTNSWYLVSYCSFSVFVTL